MRAGEHLAGTGAPPAGALARGALDAALLEAHGAGDEARLAALYAEAADLAEAAGDLDAACFYLTHAYVYALATGAAAADALHARLMARGREE